MNQFILSLQCILVLFLSSNTTTKDFIKSAGKALKTGAQQTDKAFKKAGDELSTAFNWEMNVKNNTPYLIYTAILYVDEKQQFAIGAKTAEWILTVATLPIGGGGGAAAEVGETVGTVAAREGAEAIATAAAREGTEAITTAAAREITETATTAAAREIAESATTAAAREGAESAATTGARAAARETTETATQKVGSETAETVASKATTASKAQKVLGLTPEETAPYPKEDIGNFVLRRHKAMWKNSGTKQSYEAWAKANPMEPADYAQIRKAWDLQQAQVAKVSKVEVSPTTAIPETEASAAAPKPTKPVLEPKPLPKPKPRIPAKAQAIPETVAMPKPIEEPVPTQALITSSKKQLTAEAKVAANPRYNINPKLKNRLNAQWAGLNF